MIKRVVIVLLVILAITVSLLNRQAMHVEQAQLSISEE